MRDERRSERVLEPSVDITTVSDAEEFDGHPAIMHSLASLFKDEHLYPTDLRGCARTASEVSFPYTANLIGGLSEPVQAYQDREPDPAQSHGLSAHGRYGYPR